MRSQAPQEPGQDPRFPPFLKVFRERKEPPIVVKDVFIASAVGRVRGYLARPDTPAPLPAVLLLPGAAGLTAWMKENGRDLASIGYVTLTLEPGPRPAAAPPALADEATLADLGAAVRWLRRRSDVQPECVGVVGWDRGGGQALALAAATPLQACVLCDGPVSTEPALMAGLRGTAVLGVFSGRNPDAAKTLPAFRKALTNAGIVHKMAVFAGTQPGFMDPADHEAYVRDAAEQAYREIYAFLDKYVEDALLNTPLARPGAAPPPTAKAHASIADLMRAVNETTGVRGTLVQVLASRPARQADWDRVRANAAVMAEAGGLLHDRAPPRGSRVHWLEQVEAYMAAAESIRQAAERRDYAAAQHGLEQLSARCAACHRLHR
jgi:dienelactone hydrolase